MPSPSSTTRWRAGTGIVLGLAIAAVAGGAVWFLAQPVQQLLSADPTPTATQSAVASATPTPIPTPTTDGTLAVLGDSFVRGVGAETDYVTQLGDDLGVTTEKFGETGTGLVNYGTGRPYDQRLAAVMYTQPVGLVVQASVNDYLTSTESVVAAAEVLVEHARAFDKKIAIAIIGPIYLDYELQPAVLSQRAALEELCDELDITYVDPTGWITDDTKSLYISSDNLHPTPAGYERIASRAAAQLRQFAADLP